MKTNGNVGIVVVSHSADIARGTADMVRQMVGDEVPLAFCGGNTYTEVAIIRDLPAGTVKCHIRTGLGHLRDQLAEPAAGGARV